MSSIQTQLEHLQSKYAGTGHADITKFEWAVNMKRDSYASFIGHDSLMTFMAVAHNESKEALRCRFLKEMAQPCGPPPKTEGDNDAETSE